MVKCKMLSQQAAGIGVVMAMGSFCKRHLLAPREDPSLVNPGYLSICLCLLRLQQRPEGSSSLKRASLSWGGRSHDLALTSTCRCPSFTTCFPLSVFLHHSTLAAAEALVSAFSIPAGLHLPRHGCSLLYILQLSFGSQQAPSAALVHPSITVQISSQSRGVLLSPRYYCFKKRTRALLAGEDPLSRPITHRLLSCPHVSLPPHSIFSLTPSQRQAH